MLAAIYISIQILPNQLCNFFQHALEVTDQHCSALKCRVNMLPVSRCIALFTVIELNV